MAVESMSIEYFGQLWVLKLVKYKVVISVCLFLYLIITQEPPNRSNSSNVPQILTEDLGRSTRILLAWFKRSKMVKRKLGLKFFCSYLLTSFWSPPPKKIISSSNHKIYRIPRLFSFFDISSTNKIFVKHKETKQIST